MDARRVPDRLPTRLVHALLPPPPNRGEGGNSHLVEPAGDLPLTHTSIRPSEDHSDDRGAFRMFLIVLMIFGKNEPARTGATADLFAVFAATLPGDFLGFTHVDGFLIGLVMSAVQLAHQHIVQPRLPSQLFAVNLKPIPIVDNADAVIKDLLDHIDRIERFVPPEPREFINPNRVTRSRHRP